MHGQTGPRRWTNDIIAAFPGFPPRSSGDRPLFPSFPQLPRAVDQKSRHRHLLDPAKTQLMAALNDETLKTALLPVKASVPTWKTADGPRVSLCPAEKGRG